MPLRRSSSSSDSSRRLAWAPCFGPRAVELGFKGLTDHLLTGELPVTADANKALIRRYFQEIDKGDPDVLDEFVAPDFVSHDPLPGVSGDLKGLKQAFMLFKSATPGYHTVDELIAEGDKVVARITGYGTQDGDFLGIPRTGKEIKMSGIVIWRIRRGKIVEHWAQNDTLGLLQQLGASPRRGKPAVVGKDSYPLYRASRAPAVCPSDLSRFPQLAHQEHFADMLRVLRKVDEGRCEVGARDVVRTVEEVLPPGLRSNPARLRPVREIRRPANSPVDRTQSNEALHSSEVGVGLSQNPADQVDQNPRSSPLNRGDAHADEPSDTGFAHRVEFDACDLTHHGRRTAAFGRDN